ncbi:hypothetical protein PHMEG_00018398 [Phytophthora megakarya]|uniref:Uncharacterized protein n=1 Tax=Phytophthora megakarya TaxID=4795 RepID=A0A225VVZ9_9STRA|nr:hypothetical protein PHMEG_00018398 [Phytophthora megakarya]
MNLVTYVQIDHTEMTIRPMARVLVLDLQLQKGRDGKISLVIKVNPNKRKTLKVGAVERTPGDSVEWALDSASDVHSYDGSISDNERIGNVQLRVVNNKQPHQEVVLQLEKVLHKPSAPDNLLSLDALENNGWTIRFGFCDSERAAWICKGRQQLLLKKYRGRYRLKTTCIKIWQCNNVAHVMLKRLWSVGTSDLLM